MKANIGFEARGSYSLKVLDKSGQEVSSKEIPHSCNVVTYEGAYSQLVSSGMFGNLYAVVGTGTVERDRNSISLGQESSGRSGGGSAGRVGNEIDNGDGTSILTLVRTMAFSLGEKVGTFSEVGIYNHRTTGTFVAGQLIKDEFGDPTTITLLADEQLIVTYTLEWTVPNKAKLVGTGNVQAATGNSYAYEVWAQPYFTKDAINANDTERRYGSAKQDLVLMNLDGSFNKGVGNVQDTPLWGSGSHDGSGGVTLTSTLVEAAPSDYTFADAVWVAVGVGYASNFVYVKTPETNPVVVYNPSNTSAGCPCPAVVKFSGPITKTSDDSFKIQVELGLTV